MSDVNIVSEHNANKGTEEVKVATPVWRTKNGDVPISEMSDKYLQNCFYSAQRSHKSYWNERKFGMCKFFESKMSELNSEASKRGVELQCLSKINSEFVNVLAKKADAVSL